jgi:putative endonuclease
MKKSFYVYILRSTSAVLYIGITSNLTKRLYEHKNKLVDGFTSKYNVDKLVFYEIYEDAESAILREKQLKNWNRKKKIELIAKQNPEFSEIALESIV